MEVLEADNLLWDTKLSHLNMGLEAADCELLHNTHFTEILDEFSQDMLGHLFNDPFLSDKSELMDAELSPAPHIQAEHSYSLAGDSRPQSPLAQISNPEDCTEAMECESWPMSCDLTLSRLKHEALLSDTNCLTPSVTLTNGASSNIADTDLKSPQPDTVPVTITKPVLIPDDQNKSTTLKVKLEPHEVDQFLNLSPKEAGPDVVQLPPTPPSSHGSDSEGGQSPSHRRQPTVPVQPQQSKAPVRSPAHCNSPLLTAPCKLQGPSGPLLLTEEEKRTLIAEGYPVPVKLPLTKGEEKALKKIRRKIKNKISAQESRRKKKEYMDSLEKKVESCSNENHELRRKVETLEKANRSLLEQLQGLQVRVAARVPTSCKMAGTQTSTCLMLVVLCFAVVLGSFGNRLDSFSSSVTKAVLPAQESMQESYTATVRSRHLLFYEEHTVYDDQYSTVMSKDYTNTWDKLTESARERARVAQLHGPQDPVHRQQPKQMLTVSQEAPDLQQPTSQSTRSSVLIELQSQRSFPNSDMNGTTVEIDRRVNATCLFRIHIRSRVLAEKVNVDLALPLSQ
ncbi:cyclic AMP-responsive element-binding protein 3-like protein 2 isoform X3 [Callorhinchus milii]|uniref:Cyclic AMP-responsive element-binding protein 3-like protein 2 n=1 Tax=Callorhinchus milii TaxID=7868 RepID=V9KPQ8_CALMI|nr:cyclic AMP-responsive element-binding protein 3-like protein 2 isoform X3 [Callorhinchus milii]